MIVKTKKGDKIDVRQQSYKELSFMFKHDQDLNMIMRSCDTFSEFHEIVQSTFLFRADQLEDLKEAFSENM